jgi:hypothetical protein
MAPCKHIVGLTDAAQATYTRLQLLSLSHLARGETANSHVAIFKKLEDILETAILIDPFNGERALSGSLAQIFRVTDDPIRVYYCGSANQRVITVIRIADSPLKTTNEFLAKWRGQSDDALLANLVRMLPDTTTAVISKLN